MLRYLLIQAVCRRVGSAGRPRSGVGESPEIVLFASPGFLRRFSQSAKHPAVLLAVHAACVSERIVSNEAYTKFFILGPSTAYAPGSLRVARSGAFSKRRDRPAALRVYPGRYAADAGAHLSGGRSHRATAAR